MKITNDTLPISTRGFNDIIDMTSSVQKLVAKTGIKNGQATVFVSGSTAGITTIEYEPGLLKDLPEAFEKLAPMNVRYHHDDRWEGLMHFVILRLLKHNELGMFHAYRRLGKEVAKQRASHEKDPQRRADVAMEIARLRSSVMELKRTLGLDGVLAASQARASESAAADGDAGRTDA